MKDEASGLAKKIFPWYLGLRPSPKLGTGGGSEKQRKMNRR